MNKLCSKCKQRKPLAAFSKRAASRDGVCHHCKSCIAEYYQVNRTKITEQHWKYNQTHKAEKAEYDRTRRQTIVGHLRRLFESMKYRCTNPKCPGYKYYGGRNIKVCFESFNDFCNYVINILKVDPRGLTIDRIDNNGNYEPSNIQFITQAENNRNKGKNAYRSYKST